MSLVPAVLPAAGLALQTNQLAGGINYEVTQLMQGDGTAVDFVGPGNPLAVQVYNTITANIGTVGTGNADLGKATNSPFVQGSTGVVLCAVRKDAITNIPTADGNYGPIQTGTSGGVKVEIVAGQNVGGTSITDNATFTRGSTSETPAGGVVETAAPSLTNGRAAALSMTTGGALRVDVSSGGISSATQDAVAPADGVQQMFRASLAAPAAVSADGDSVAPWAGRNGTQIHAAYAETDSIYQGGNVRTVSFASIAASTSGNNTIVAAAGASNKIRVLGYSFVVAGAVNVKWQSGAGGTDLTGLMTFDASGKGIAEAYCPLGLFETAANTLLNLNLSGAVLVGGRLTYAVVQ